MSNVANPVAATTSAANLLGQQNYDDLTLFDRKDLSTISIIDDLNNAQETNNIDTFELIDDTIMTKSTKSSGPCKNFMFSSSGLIGTSFNFINSIIGSGVIGMPYAFSQGGIGMTFALFALVGLLTDYSIVMLITNGWKTGAKSYQDLVYLVVGSVGYYFLVVIQFLYPFISLVSYNIILGDTITKVFRRLLNISADSFLDNRIFIIFVVNLLVTLPLSLLRDISKLAKTSFISCVLVIVVFVAMVIRLFTMRDAISETGTDKYRPIGDFYGLTDSFSIMAFGFMCHHNSFLIFNSMSSPSVHNWSKVTHISLVFSTGFSIVFGLVGYLTFGILTQGDIFENYCHKDDFMNLIRLFYALIIMFSYPLECFVCREVVENTLFAARKGDKVLHTGITVFMVLVAMLLSFTTDCLGVVLELNGSLVATSLAYILPSICTVLINYRVDRKISSVLVPIGLGLIGLFVLVAGLISVVDKIVNGYECSHGNELIYCSTFRGLSNASQSVFVNVSATSTTTNRFISSTNLTSYSTSSTRV